MREWTLRLSQEHLQMENDDHYCQGKVSKSLVKKKYECEYSHLQMENYDNCILWKQLNGISDNVITEVNVIKLTNSQTSLYDTKWCEHECTEVSAIFIGPVIIVADLPSSCQTFRLA